MKIKKVSSKIIWKNKYGYKLHEDKFIYNKKESVYNFISRNPGFVAILAVDKDKKIYLVSSYRYPIEKTILELPMGYIDKGEKPLETAKRELKEETGLTASSWKEVDVFTIGPGFIDMKCHLFLATNLKNGSNKIQEDEFDLKSIKTNIDKIKNSKEPITRIAYYYFKNSILEK